MKEVRVRPILNGFVVAVGCAEIYFLSIEELCVEIARYAKDPDRIEKDYLLNAVNKINNA